MLEKKPVFKATAAACCGGLSNFETYMYNERFGTLNVIIKFQSTNTLYLEKVWISSSL